MKIRNRIVEIFGPSAVGKTTLLRRFLRDTNEEWFTRNEIDLHARQQLSPFHERLFAAKSANILSKLDKPLMKRAKSVMTLSRILTADIAALSNLEGTPLLDEGVLHHTSRYLVRFSREDPEAVTEFFSTRAFVHLTGRPEKILSHVHKRLEADPADQVYGRFDSDDAILEYLDKSIQHRSEMADFVKEFDCPVISLDVDTPLSGNAQAFQEFLGTDVALGEASEAPMPGAAAG